MPLKPGTAELRRAFYRLDGLGRRLWTLQRVADRAGVSVSHACQIINGRYRRDTPARRAIIKALGLG